MKEYKCYRCRDGEAPITGECPECHRVYGGIEKRVLENVEVPSEKGFNPVPEGYRGVLWSKEHFVKDNRDKKSDRFMMFANTLEAIQNIFKKGKVPKKSYMIVAPRRFSKMTFAYSCMQLASSCGYSVFPVLDTQQLKRFLTLSVEKPYSEFLKVLPYTYEDFLTADIAFITVTKDYNRNGAWEVIDQVIDIRSRMDRSTIILSRYSFNDITGFDYYNRFKGIVADENNQGKRYPVFIQYTDSTMNVDF